MTFRIRIGVVLAGVTLALTAALGMAAHTGVHSAPLSPTYRATMGHVDHGSAALAAAAATPDEYMKDR